MDRQTLKQVIIDQSPIQLPEHFVQRSAFAKIQALHSNSHAIVMTGIRRRGKSTLLQSIRKKSQESDYYINFDDDRLVLFELSDFQLLFELYNVQKTFFLTSAPALH